MDPNDEIVISGIAGRYPECDSFEEFKDALLNGVDLITEDSRRFPPGTYDTPRRSGKINGVEYFDAGYFGISPRQADLMEPRHRIMFETAFEAIVDSGYNPKELRGTKTGVYVALSGLDCSQSYKDIEHSNGYTIIGTNPGQIANRTSYCFDLKGPSFILDTACSSGLYAMVHAIKAMEHGDIESAIVSAVQINFHPHESREFNLLNMLAKDGKCKVFATDRDGYARSEAIITVLLQKKSKCRRLYSTVLGSNVNCDGFKVEGITFPSLETQLDLIDSVYKKYELNPDDVSFVEMHGTGTPAGDEIECQTISEFFCRNRKEPLPVGAVKTNMGHSEVSSGLCSLTKILVAMETGIIPANLHCEKLDYSLSGINNGKLKVVTENLPWNGGTVSLNCFGFGGANAHAVLKSNEKAKLKPSRRSHRLVTVSGRTEESVRYYLESVEKRQDDTEFLALIDEIHKMDVEGHLYRGYTVLGENPVTEINRINRGKRPIWFIYTGMGCQWPGMGRDLMKIDVFRNTFKRCANALRPYDIDIEKIVLSEDPAIFDDITNCFAAIAATEIALTDVLKSLGIEPDGFAGHSLGEVGCAYCNGDLTPEQAALIGFARGYATRQSKCAPGQMAAVALSKEEILKWLPEGVYVACINTSDSVTITGPKDLVQQTVKHLTEKGVFARLVKTADYAFHSKYLYDIGPTLQKFVSTVITDPKPRSSKWISTSWEETEWDNPISTMNSCEYHHHNFAHPVLFSQVFRHIPKDAILIEVGPHGLLTSILKKEMGPEATCLSLANRSSKDNVQFFSSNIGKLFINGGQPNLRGFYDNVTFPVGRGTHNIGSLIKWDHSIKWFTPFYESTRSFGKKVTVNTKMEQYGFLVGHNIDGRVLMAATGYLELVWKVVADITAKPINELPIIFESVKISRATVLPDGQDVVFWINIMKQSGNFEIFEGGSVCCSGTAKLPKNISSEFLNPDIPKATLNGYMPLDKHDVYKCFRLKGYHYSGLFQGIELADVCGSLGRLKWNGNFTTFLDSMLQLTLIPESSVDLFLPTRLQKLVIDPVKHLAEISDENNDISVFYDKDLKVIRSGGIEIVNLENSVAPRKHVKENAVLETHIFVPYITDSHEREIDVEPALKLALQIIIENSGNINTLRASEIVTNKENSLVGIVKEIMKDDPFGKIEILDGNPRKLDLILSSDGHSEKSMLTQLNQDGFVLFHGDQVSAMELGIPVVYQNTYKQKGIFLLRNVTPIKSYEVILVNNSDFHWLEKAKECIKTEDVVYLFTQGDDGCGIVGLVKCLNLEPSERASVKCVFIQEKYAATFYPDLDCYNEQLFKKLTMNVLRNGIWGSYRYVPVNKMKNIETAHASNYTQIIGDLSSFKWVERPPHYYKTSPDSEYVYIYYSALNFRDVMVATGQVTVRESTDPSAPNVILGFEYSGVSKSGRRVMGIVPQSSCSLQLMTDPLFTWEVPKSWSLEEAASVPSVYATCYYAMIMRGQMQTGKSILIHAGAGGIGIAAISISLSMNCEVFTTCGSPEKQEFLLRMFPKLKPENIGNSRNTSFEQMVMKNTKGRGVDFVLNSLAADMYQASMRCVAERGQFLEIGKVDLWAGTLISSSLFAKNTSFHGVQLDNLFNEVTEEAKEISRLVAEGIAKGVVRPLPRTIFTEDEVEDAFRFLSTGKHKGKVLIKIRSETTDPTQSLHRTIQATPRIYFHPDKTYILVGGLGGFGLELTKFLIKRCARKIVLNSRRGVKNGYQSLCLKKWSELEGVTVKINTDDTSSINGAESLVKFAEEMGPIGGIFNMALVLQDALFTNQTAKTFDVVFKSKIYSGENMDKVSRARCSKLDHFVVFSSIVAGRGNPGQSNYGMANSALERLCDIRRKDGLPGLAVQYGPVGDVGALTDDTKYDKAVNALGLVAQSINSCINALETFMLQPCTVGSTFVVDEQNVVSSSTSKSPTETIANILGIKEVGLIDKNQSLIQIGLDSLMIAEIKQTLYRNFNIELSTEEIRDLTFTQISKLLENSTNSVETAEPLAVTNGVNGYYSPGVNAMLRKEPVVEITSTKPNTTKIFFLHPLEGNIEIMLPLAQKLNAKVYGLQSTKDANFESLKAYATHFIKEIRNVQSKGPYILCGYSFGGALAFEIGVQLEKQNEAVDLLLIDGAPSFSKKILQYMYEQKEKSETKSKVNILKGFVKTFDEINQDGADKILDETLPWDKQLELLGNFIAENTSYKSKDVAVSADRFKQRVAAAYFYEPSDVFNGQVTLIRSKDVYKELPPDYDLQKICKQPIKLERLDGDHKEILLGKNLTRMADYINNILK